ncbi:uncharacterized protein LOC122506413 [Leptopilina heterotoma]|uniref:uncharacterized protein LOC122506413 n=1 Tax=Leptopilina heterotoma TaxID=63436 RepID=UPI001CA868BB|nr:uncharacterized protein LOC122506413 [Leptopilina heterotoma]
MRENAVNNEMINIGQSIGENIGVHIDTWEVIIRKGDSIFVRELMEILWGRKSLKLKCLDEKRANKGKFRDRTALEPEKKALIKDLLYEKITQADVTGYARKMRMSKLSRYMSLKLSDVLNKI